MLMPDPLSLALERPVDAFCVVEPPFVFVVEVSAIAAVSLLPVVVASVASTLATRKLLVAVSIAVSVWLLASIAVASTNLAALLIRKVLVWF